MAQLEVQVQTHGLCPHSKTDSVQINAPEYDSDIDGNVETEIQPQHNNKVTVSVQGLETLSNSQSHAKEDEAEAAPAAANSEGPTLQQDPNHLRILQNTHYIQTLNPPQNNTNSKVVLPMRERQRKKKMYN